MRVSLITTVRNEADSISSFLQGLLSQTHQPDEVVIADGGSTDGTVAAIQAFAKSHPHVKVISAPGNIAVGRNAAIKAATHSIIAVTDAGSTAEPTWLEEILKPLSDPKVGVSSGFFQVAPTNTFEAVSSALLNQQASELNDDWLPSSRSIAFRKEAWEKVSGYPENLTMAGEDTLFDLNLKKAGYVFKFAPKAVVHWQPRSTLKAFWKQQFSYARGDGQYWPQSVGYGKKLGFYTLLAAVKIAALVLELRELYLGTVVVYIAYLLFRSRKTWQRSRNFGYTITSIPLVIIFDLANITGFLRGVFEWSTNPRYRQGNHHEK
jgi:cellulose synthase/poly-beta-1,6-N-acetylglucosamine synthase-like glycosyltransferase